MTVRQKMIQLGWRRSAAKFEKHSGLKRWSRAGNRSLFRNKRTSGLCDSLFIVQVFSLYSKFWKFYPFPLLRLSLT